MHYIIMVFLYAVIPAVVYYYASEYFKDKYAEKLDKDFKNGVIREYPQLYTRPPFYVYLKGLVLAILSVFVVNFFVHIVFVAVGKTTFGDYSYQKEVIREQFLKQ